MEVTDKGVLVLVQTCFVCVVSGDTCTLLQAHTDSIVTVSLRYTSLHVVYHVICVRTHLFMSTG